MERDWHKIGRHCLLGPIANDRSLLFCFFFLTKRFSWQIGDILCSITTTAVAAMCE
jgi:hypothetical protein